MLERFRQELLQRVHDSNCNGVVFDLSGLAMLDAYEFEGLARVARMCSIMGARPILVGLAPGIVSALVESGVPTQGLEVALTLDRAFDQLHSPAVGDNLLEPVETPIG